MGSSKKQTVGYWYRPILDLVMCQGEIDALLRVRGGEVDAWRGEMTEPGTLTIDAPEIWGGEDSEGGMQGEADVMFGGPDQMPNEWAQANIGPDPSAHRGVARFLWKAGRYGAMNPYPKPLSLLVRRILKGWHEDVCWYQETSVVPLGSHPGTIGVVENFAGGLEEYTLETGNAGQFTVVSDGTGIALKVSGNQNATIRKPIGFAGQLQQVSLRFKPVQLAPDDFATFDLRRSDGLYVFGFNQRREGVGKPTCYVSLGTTTSTDAVFSDVDLLIGNWYSFVADYDPSNDRYVCQVRDGSDTVLQTVYLNLSGSQIQNATTLVFRHEGSGGEGWFADVHMLFNAVVVEGQGMNPAHIIYDSLTDPRMQGEPVEMVNDASFRAAADKLYDEGFGLCARFDPDQETVEQFRQRVCSVINAQCSRSTVDGQWYLDLIRGDYDIGSLPVLTDDDIIEFKAEPAVIDDMVNQVAVEWFDRDLKQARTTAPLHSLGAIQAMGTIVAETLKFPEIPVESLGQRRAGMALREKSTPLWRYTATTTRKPYNWRIGTYFRLQAPKHGVTDSVCLVGDIDKGTLRSGAISLVAVQDVFGMPDSTYVVGQPPVPPPDPSPQPAVAQVAFEAPYVELAATLPAGELAALDEHAGFLQVVGARPPGGRTYQLNVAPEGGEFESAGNFDWCPTAIVVEAADHEDTAFTLANPSLLDRVSVGTAALWGTEIVRVDALDREALTVTLGRGCADSVWQKHAAGERIWFYDEWASSDLAQWATAEEVHARLLTRTGNAMLAIGTAPQATVLFDQRQARPYPPANVRVNGAVAPDAVVGDAEITGFHRDRLLQADQLIDQTEPDIGPEAGTTYVVRNIDVAIDTETYYQDGITVFPHVVPGGDLASVNRLEVYAVRDGLESRERAVFIFSVGSVLLTEDDEPITTETDDPILME